MRISIALCTLNGEKYLAEQLGSIASQSRLPDELIVSDDASQDSTVAIVQEFAATAPFAVQITTNPHRLGAVRNFERAIVETSGDVIFLCDQDDVWHREKIAVMLRAFDSNDRLGAVFTNARLGNTNLWDHIGFTHRERRAVNRGRALDILFEHNVVTGATLAFRERWKEAILPIPAVEGVLHDQWIATVIAAHAGVRAIDAPLIDYRQHDAQAVGAGVAAGGVRRWVEAARDTGGSDYDLKARQLEAILHRLERTGASRRRIDQLGERIAHLHTRASLPAAKLARVPIVARELARLRYFRYSNHLWSVAKDLLW